MTARTTGEMGDLDPHRISPDEFCDRLFGYLETAGQSTYDEAVTQLDHGLQCAQLAEAAGFDAATQVAALLHDIGHLMLDEHDRQDDFLDRDQRHEIVGAHLLTRWFGAEVGAVVALHVPAKRYLVAVDAGYRGRLSPASLRSLEVQGGPMTDTEVARFEALPHSRIAVELRRWDDLGKVQGQRVQPLEHWRPAIRAVLGGSAK